jgi:hypothetical protein
VAVYPTNPESDTVRVTAEFDAFGFAQLRRAAQEQGVSLETLLVHAAMYYIADLDAGRPAARVFPGD